jgi:hypothetical protein
MPTQSECSDTALFTACISKWLAELGQLSVSKTRALALACNIARGGKLERLWIEMACA